jgi:hypothetical protein
VQAGEVDGIAVADADGLDGSTVALSPTLGRS